MARLEAEEIVKQVRASVATWRKEAAVLGIPRAEQELMAAAFEE